MNALREQFRLLERETTDLEEKFFKKEIPFHEYVMEASRLATQRDVIRLKMRHVPQPSVALSLG